MDEAQAHPGVFLVSDPKKENFSDENINSLDSYQKSKTCQTLENSLVDHKEVPPGRHSAVPGRPACEPSESSPSWMRTLQLFGSSCLKRLVLDLSLVFRGWGGRQK